MTNATSVRAVFENVLASVAPEVDLATVDPDEALSVQLDLDSMDFVTIMERLQAAAGIIISDRDASQLQTLNQVLDYLSRNMS
jgi:acyl carrier protein